MKLPKRGFSNARFKVIHAEVNVSDLEKRFNGAEVSRESLISEGFLKGIDRRRPIKVLGQGEIKKSLKFTGIDKFSASAKEKIEKAGGSIEAKGK
jgi:large subunit ribosomal protein L15